MDEKKRLWRWVLIWETGLRELREGYIVAEDFETAADKLRIHIKSLPNMPSSQCPQVWIYPVPDAVRAM